MRVDSRSNRSNLVRVEIKGRKQLTRENNKGNTVYRVKKNEPVRYSLEELKQIGRKVEKSGKYRTIGAEACYMIRKLRLNKCCGKKKKLSKKEVKGERGILRSNLIEIKAEKSLGLNMTNRRFTMMLANVQSIKNKQDVVVELLEDSKTDVAVLTETWLTDDDGIWVQGSEFYKHNYKIDECHRKNRKGGGFSTSGQA